MCLDMYQKINLETKQGWKLVSKYELNKELYRTVCMDSLLNKNKWNVDYSRKYIKYGCINPSYKDEKEYVTGYHIFLNKGDAKQWLGGNVGLIKKVEFGDVTATGMQDGYKVVVARQIRFIPVWWKRLLLWLVKAKD